VVWIIKKKFFFIKKIPLNIANIFKEISLAYWIMVILTLMVELRLFYFVLNLFSKKELQSLLSSFGIKTILKIRNKEKDRYRIRFSKTSVALIKELVMPYMHKDFLYKLGD